MRNKKHIICMKCHKIIALAGGESPYSIICQYCKTENNSDDFSSCG